MILSLWGTWPHHRAGWHRHCKLCQSSTHHCRLWKPHTGDLLKAEPQPPSGLQGHQGQGSSAQSTLTGVAETEVARLSERFSWLLEWRDWQWSTIIFPPCISSSSVDARSLLWVCTCLAYNLCLSVNGIKTYTSEVFRLLICICELSQILN